MSNEIVPTTRKYIPPTEFQRRLGEVFEWLPELLIMGIFLLAAMLLSGFVSLICLVLAAGPAAWIIRCRARIARQNAKVLAEYDADLAAADARALDTVERGGPPVMSMPSNQTPAARTTGWGKSRATDIVTTALRAAVRSPAGDQREADQDDMVQDDVALDDLQVQGIRMVDLDPAKLAKGSAAWNAATAYALIACLPHAAGHFEVVAREWAALANADNPAGSTNTEDRA